MGVTPKGCLSTRARELVSGPDHRQNFAVRADLARWTGDAGDPAAARDQFAALVFVRVRVSGPEHPETWAARHSLAYWTAQVTEAT